MVEPEILSGPLLPSTTYSRSQRFWEIQEEKVLFLFPLDVNPPDQWAWVFPGCLSKRGKIGLLLTWAGLQSLSQQKGHLSLILVPWAHSGGP